MRTRSATLSNFALLLLARVASGCTPLAGPDDASTLDATDANDAVAVLDADAGSVLLDAPHTPPQSWSVLAAGPYNTGYRTFQATYDPPGSATARTVTVHAWYPTLATAGRHPRYANLFLDAATIVDAPLAPSPFAGARYPVHVFSHGHRGFGGNAAFLMRHFASHGWISIAPDHLGNTIDNSPEPRAVNLYYLRSLDITASLDALAALRSPHALAGVASTDRVLLSGHSFGTHTVWASAGATFDSDAIAARCLADMSCTADDVTAFRAGVQDRRVVAVIPMAGSIRAEWFGDRGHETVTVPVLAMSGSADPVGADLQWSRTAPLSMSWIDVRGACHQFFGLGGCAEISDTLQTTIVGTYALALGRRYSLNDGDSTVVAVLDGTRVVSDTVVFQRR